MRNKLLSITHHFGNSASDLFSDGYNILAILISSFFASIFCYISIMRYLSLTENVLDLGVNASLLYGVLRGGLFATPSNPNPIAFSKLIYIPLGVIYYFYSKEWILLIYQNIFLSLSPIALYFISRHAGLTKKISIVVEVLYFLYYPFSGVYWFDFHMMAFFPTPFLFGILMYRKNSRMWMPLLLVAAISDYMAPILVGWFLLIEIGKKIRKGDHNFKNMIPEFFLILILSVIFLLPSLYTMHTYYSNYLSVQNYGDLYLTPMLKYDFVIRVLLPLLFIPLAGIEYLSMIVPFAAFVYFNNYAPYQSLMFFQYPALYAPIIMFSLVIGLSRMEHALKNCRSKFLSRYSIRIIAVYLLVINIVLFSLYTPIGSMYSGDYAKNALNPQLTGSNQYYDIPGKMIPKPYDSAILTMMSSIPAGSSILVEGNLPELLQNHVAYLGICKGNPAPQYILNDPYNYQFYKELTVVTPGYNFTFLEASNYFMLNHHYGLYSSYEGATLYELNYSGQPTSFTPLICEIKMPNFNSAGKMAFLPPGNFNISVYGVTSSNTNLIVNNLTISHSWISSGVEYFNFSTNVYLSDLSILLKNASGTSGTIFVTQEKL